MSGRLSACFHYLTPCSQLEAIIRVSESIAKVTLSPTVLPHHVEEAIRLFKQSTMHAVAAGSVDGMSNSELKGQMESIEKELKRRLPIGWSTSYASLSREFVTAARVLAACAGKGSLCLGEEGGGEVLGAEKGCSSVWRLRRDQERAAVLLGRG